jgi:hypothetical protein
MAWVRLVCTLFLNDQWFWAGLKKETRYAGVRVEQGCTFLQQGALVINAPNNQTVGTPLSSSFVVLFIRLTEMLVLGLRQGCFASASGSSWVAFKPTVVGISTLASQSTAAAFTPSVRSPLQTSVRW